MQAFAIRPSFKPLQPRYRGTTAAVLLVGLMFLTTLIWLRQHAASNQAPARPLAALGTTAHGSLPARLQTEATPPRQGIKPRE